jgi:hypothetical protein
LGLGIDPQAVPEPTAPVQGILGRYVIARPGDTASGLMGSSAPMAVGAFMAGNDLPNSNLRAGSLYFIPDDINAFGDNAQRGQGALNADNQRLADLATQRSDATLPAQRQATQSPDRDSWSSTHGSAGSFASMSAAQPSLFDETQSWKVGLNGRIEGNVAYAGPGAVQVPMAAPESVTSNFFGMVKDATLTASGDLGVWGDKQGGALGTLAYGVGGLGYMVGTALPGSAGEGRAQ